MPLLGAPTPPTVGGGPYTVDEVPACRLDKRREHLQDVLVGDGGEHLALDGHLGV